MDVQVGLDPVDGGIGARKQVHVEPGQLQFARQVDSKQGVFQMGSPHLRRKLKGVHLVVQVDGEADAVLLHKGPDRSSVHRARLKPGEGHVHFNEPEAVVRAEAGQDVFVRKLHQGRNAVDHLWSPFYRTLSLPQAMFLPLCLSNRRMPDPATLKRIFASVS